MVEVFMVALRGDVGAAVSELLRPYPEFRSAADNNR
jgi:hypothetical protein